MADGYAKSIMGEIALRTQVRRYAGVFKNTVGEHRSKGGKGGGFSKGAGNLWRVAQGSNSAVFKKIYRGGTKSPQQLGNQLNYLFGKSTSVFGNMVEHDAKARSLSADQRDALVEQWSDGWRGNPKNGHTSHLLLSFPDDLAPKRALKIAEIWAAEMFQSGEHADDEWAYVAALHTDRNNPHVHIVVNNRGLINNTWFYMAKDHDFDLQKIKGRIVEIAAETGVYLDSSSRLERGVLTYGPSRAEIEAARSGHRPVVEKRRQGRALADGLAKIEESVSTLRSLASFAAVAVDDELAAKFHRAAEILENGGILKLPVEIAMTSETVQTRGDLANAFNGWLEKSESAINSLPEQERAPLRRELYEVAGEVARDLGDDRGAQLMHQAPRSELYQTQISADALSRGGEKFEVGSDGAGELRAQIWAQAKAVGISAEAIQQRMEHGAANAWQEREWVKEDIAAVAEANKLDLSTEGGRSKTAEIVDGFYASAEKALARVVEAGNVYENDRVTRTLDTMADSLTSTGAVKFEDDDHAQRFAADLKERYGDDVMQRIAEGDDRALAVDFADPKHRRQVARAVVAAAETHEGMGMTLKEVGKAKELLPEIEEQQRIQDRDHDQGLEI